MGENNTEQLYWTPEQWSEWYDREKNRHHPEDDIPQQIQTLIEQDVQARGVVITEGMTYQDYFIKNQADMSPEVVEQVNELNKIYAEYLEERKALGL